MQKTIFTVGHSTREIDEIIHLLKFNNIEILADVRSYPGSKRYPQFNRENLIQSLKEENIEYVHLKELGGKRTPKKESKHTEWKNKSFRAYADHMETDEFKTGIKKLTDIAENKKTAIMCAEAVWWKCHRSMIADFLKKHKWQVVHILNEKKTEEHPYTQPEREKQLGLFDN